MALNTTAATWVASTTLTAAQLNTEVRDAINGIQSAWTAYTPTWTSSGTAPVLNNGTITGKWRQIGKTIDFQVLLTPGSTTTFGTGNYSISLPIVAVSDGFFTLGHAQLLISGGRFPGQLIINAGATTCQPWLATSSTDPRLTQMTPTVPGTFASTNTLRIVGRYETP